MKSKYQQHFIYKRDCIRNESENGFSLVRIHLSKYLSGVKKDSLYSRGLILKQVP